MRSDRAFLALAMVGFLDVAGLLFLGAGKQLAGLVALGAGFWLSGYFLAVWLSSVLATRHRKLWVPPAWWQWVLVRVRWCGCLLLCHSWRRVHPAGMRPVCMRCGLIGQRDRVTLKGCEV